MSLFSWLRSAPHPTSNGDKLDEFRRKCLLLLSDEQKQNEMLPTELRQLLIMGADTDRLPNGKGPFGRTATNPIPVNGPIGEVVYISALRTTNGSYLLGHRVGSNAGIDVFETVSSDGLDWGLLYFSMYHPRRSRLVPNELRFAVGHDLLGVSATAQNVPDFPNSLPDAVGTWCKGTLGIPLVRAGLTALIGQTTFRRPAFQEGALAGLRLQGGSTAPVDPWADPLQKIFDQLQTLALYDFDEFMPEYSFDPDEIAYFVGAILINACQRLGPKEAAIRKRMLHNIGSMVFGNVLKKTVELVYAKTCFRNRLSVYSPEINPYLDRNPKDRQPSGTILYAFRHWLTDGNLESNRRYDDCVEMYIITCINTVIVFFEEGIEVEDNEDDFRVF